MKKLLFVIAAITFTAALFAQNTGFGVKAGITSANVKFSGEGVNISADSKIGFYGGVFAQIGVSENFAVQPELLYSLLGTKSTGGDADDEGKLNLSYISVTGFS